MIVDGISVVIPNYNGNHLLKDCIPSIIRALIKTGLKYEVVVSDDASQDSPKDLLSDKFSSVVLLMNRENLGFGGNVNRAVRKAKYPLVLILNSDITVEKDYFSSQLLAFKRNDTFAVGGKIIDQSTKKIEGAWKPYLRHGKIKWKAVDYSGNSLIKTFYVCGGNALVSKEKFLELGGYMAVYKPFYLEDVDLSVRAWRSGYKCYYSSTSICYHKKSSTIEAYHKKRDILIASNRNYLSFNYLHSTHRCFWAWKVKIVFQVMISILKLNNALKREYFLDFYKKIGVLDRIRKTDKYLYDIRRVVDCFNNDQMQKISRKISND